MANLLPAVCPDCKYPFEEKPLRYRDIWLCEECYYEREADHIDECVFGDTNWSESCLGDDY